MATSRRVFSRHAVLCRPVRDLSFSSYHVGAERPFGDTLVAAYPILNKRGQRKHSVKELGEALLTEVITGHSSHSHCQDSSSNSVGRLGVARTCNEMTHRMCIMQYWGCACSHLCLVEALAQCGYTPGNRAVGIAPAALCMRGVRINVCGDSLVRANRLRLGAALLRVCLPAIVLRKHDLTLSVCFLVRCVQSML